MLSLFLSFFVPFLSLFCPFQVIEALNHKWLKSEDIQDYSSPPVIRRASDVLAKPKPPLKLVESRCTQTMVDLNTRSSLSRSTTASAPSLEKVRAITANETSQQAPRGRFGNLYQDISVWDKDDFRRTTSSSQHTSSRSPSTISQVPKCINRAPMTAPKQHRQFSPSALPYFNEGHSGFPTPPERLPQTQLRSAITGNGGVRNLNTFQEEWAEHPPTHASGVQTLRHRYVGRDVQEWSDSPQSYSEGELNRNYLNQNDLNQNGLNQNYCSSRPTTYQNFHF